MMSASPSSSSSSTPSSSALLLHLAGYLVHGFHCYSTSGMAALRITSSHHHHAFLLQLVCLLLLIHCNRPVSASNLSTDAAALLALKSSLLSGSGAAAVAVLRSWNASSIPAVCASWEGVNCTVGSSPRVTSLRLPGKSLYGTLPAAALAPLDALQTLSLHSNALSGHLPSPLPSLPSLKRLYLQDNRLSGPLPLTLAAWPLLLQLDLSFNAFSGSIPPSLSSTAPRLRTLSLQNNTLSGALPSLDLPSLTVFSVSNNQLSGPIPALLSRFSPDNFTGNSLCGLPLPPCEQDHHKKLSTRAIVGIAVGGSTLLLSLLAICFLVLCKKRSRRKEDPYPAASRSNTAVSNSTQALGGKRGGNSSSSYVTAKESEDSRNKLVVIGDNARALDLEDLLTASAEVLGKGSLGTSYKAVLEDGSILVVKRLLDVEESRRDEHRQHIESIGCLRHQNLLPLRAYYFDKDEKLLVYDYMPHGSLSALLHANKGAGRPPLDWNTRFKVALTSAQGLAHLHSQDMVHGNIKASNVLLVNNTAEACVADYGLIQMIALAAASRGSRAAYRAWMGYRAPEVTDPKQVTQKGDVFSYGVLLLELLTGRAPMSAQQQSAASPGMEEGVDLPRWVQSVVREEWTVEVFDPDLMVNNGNGGTNDSSSNKANSNTVEEMVHLLQVALPCVSPSPAQRPTMAEVLTMMHTIRRQDGDGVASSSIAEIHS